MSEPEPPPADASAETDDAAAEAARGGALPPAELSALFQMLGGQAMLAMGKLPTPDGKTMKDLALARHAIDMLTMLQAKTESHRTPQESAMLQGVLYQLQMSYVEASK